MPKKLDECVKKLVKKCKSKESAWAICSSKIKKVKKKKP